MEYITEQEKEYAIANADRFEVAPGRASVKIERNWNPITSRSASERIGWTSQVTVTLHRLPDGTWELDGEFELFPHDPEVEAFAAKWARIFVDEMFGA